MSASTTPREALAAAKEAMFRKFNGMVRPALAKVILDAAAPHIRAQALEDAALEIARLVQIGRTPSKEVSPDMERDHKAFVEAGSIPDFLCSRAALERTTHAV